VTQRHQAHSLVTDAGPLMPPPPRPPAPWITVTGGKGGVGKTLIATNLAIGMARAGYRTLLVDLDPGLANIDVHLRLAPRFSIEDLADGTCDAREAMTAAPGPVAVLCGRSGSTRLADDRAFVDVALDAVEASAQDFDVVICDTGSGVGHAVLETARRSRQLLAVTTPDPAAITDTYALCKLFLSRDMTTPRLLVNQVRSRDEAMRTAGRLSAVSQRFLGRELEMMGWLHRDAMLGHSVRDQRPFALAGVGPAMEDLRALTAAALSAVPEIRRRGKGIKRDSLTRLRAAR
jgi:flagellar biosynthesis protein FlhG